MLRIIAGLCLALGLSACCGMGGCSKPCDCSCSYTSAHGCPPSCACSGAEKVTY